MSDLSELKITNGDVAQHGVVSAPDMLTGSAQENKAVFDGLVCEVVKDKHNGLVDALEESLAWEPYDAEKSYVPDNKVVYNGSSYLCTTACEGVLPTNASCWRLIAAKGADGTGAGDMRKDVYDPNGMETDIFAYAAERANTYTKDETFSKAQSLSAATAQKFVTDALSLTAPATPDEALDALEAAAALVSGKVDKTTTVNGTALSNNVLTSIVGFIDAPLAGKTIKINTPFVPMQLIVWDGFNQSSIADQNFWWGWRGFGAHMVNGNNNQLRLVAGGSYSVTITGWDDDGVTVKFSPYSYGSAPNAAYYVSA